MSDASGYCAKCDRPAPVGQPCPESGCTEAGYHAIPAEYHLALRDPAVMVRDRDIGRVIDSEYLLVSVLGRGTYGKVYLALQRPLQYKTALKLLSYQSHDDDIQRQVLEKFEGEARSLSRLDHPNIVKLIRYGRVDGVPFIVMEYVDQARRLKDAIDDRVALGAGFDFTIVQHVATQLLSALACAHDEGIVHRDLKPDNVMLQEVVGDGYFVRVLDFGLAKFVGDGHTRSTAMIAGTPAYMAPEQVARKNIGPWSDIYAVGLIILEMLVGVRVFQWWDPQSVFALKGDPAFNPVENFLDLDLPQPVFDFLRKATAFAVEERYQSALACRNALAWAFAPLKSQSRRSICLADMEQRLSSDAMSTVTRLRSQDLAARQSQQTEKRPAPAALPTTAAPTEAAKAPQTIFVDHEALAMRAPFVKAPPEADTGLLAEGPGLWVWVLTLAFVGALLGTALYLWLGSRREATQKAPTQSPVPSPSKTGPPRPLHQPPAPIDPRRPPVPPTVGQRPPTPPGPVTPPPAPSRRRIDVQTPQPAPTVRRPDLSPPSKPAPPKNPLALLPKAFQPPSAPKLPPPPSTDVGAVCRDGIANVSRGALIAAERQLKQCVAQLPTMTIAYLYLSTIASARGDAIGSCRYLKQYIALIKSPSVVKAMRQQYSRQRCPQLIKD